MGKSHILSSTRIRIYVLLWTSACLTHFSWQSFDYSVVCLRQEEIKAQQASGQSQNRTSNATQDTTDSLSWLGPAFASWSAGTLAVTLPAGYLIDRFGVRFVFGVGVPLAALLNCFIPHALHHTLPGLCVLRFLTGALTQGIRGSAQNSVAGKWAPITELGLLLGVGSAFSSSGNMLANTIGATLCSTTSLGWPGLFYGVAVAQGIWFIAWWSFYCERPEWHKKITLDELYRLGSTRSFNAGMQSAPHLPALKEGQQVPWSHIVTSKPVWAAAVSRFANAWVTALVATYGPTFFHTTTTDSLLINSIYASLPFLGNLSIRIISGLLSDHSMKCMSRTNSLKLFNTLAFASTAICMGIGAFTICRNALINAIVLITAFGCLGANVAGSFKSPVLLAPRYAGTLTGAMEILSSIGSIISLNTIAILAPEGDISQWRKIAAVSCVLATIAMVAFLIFGSGECQPWADPIDEKAQWRNLQIPQQKVSIQELTNKIGYPVRGYHVNGKLMDPADFEPLNNVPLLGRSRALSNLQTYNLSMYKFRRGMLAQDII